MNKASDFSVNWLKRLSKFEYINRLNNSTIKNPVNVDVEIFPINININLKHILFSIKATNKYI